MSRKGKKPDSGQALAGLKDFQRRTVDYVFRRLYTDPDYTRRFLIADEVGLGKTLVARGVIAKAIDHLWDDIQRIDIVYICSNASIARQNIARLNVMCDQEFSMPDRITLLPERVKGLESNRVNFVAFTPGTSFHLKSSTGRIEERALLYRLLHKQWGLRGKAPRYVLQVNASLENFNNWCDWYISDNVKIDNKIHEAFLRELDVRCADEQRRGVPDLRARFEVLCASFSRADAKISSEVCGERANVIGELRELLAEVCLEALEPDLIILDEFQRFKNLLRDDDNAGALAQKLFRFADEEEHSEARVILLSATPYKMYSMNHEIAEDDHYADFLATLSFLLDDPKAEAEFEQLLKMYSRKFFQHGGIDLERMQKIISEMECRLRKVMVRTEKLSATASRDGMLKQVASRNHSLQPQDLHAFIKLQDVAGLLDHFSTIEYWKSAPYLLNFMDDYALKRRFQREIGTAGERDLIPLLRQRKHWLLKWGDISRYRKIDPNNAKLRSLLSETVEKGLWRLLWIPPSLPYHQLEGAFADDALQNVTKRLIFSCWKVVPKVVAALTSYEAERRAICSLDPKARNTTKERKTRRPLLRFAMTANRLTGMPVLGIIYPGVRLSTICDPLAIRREYASEYEPTLEDVLGEAERRVEDVIRTLRVNVEESGPEDERWYWVLPALMDIVADSELTLEWLGQEILVEEWRKHSPHRDGEHDGRWGDHIDQMRRVISDLESGATTLGKPPEDLARVIACIGVAGFGCCALRALTRHDPEDIKNTELRNEAGALAHAFLSLFNVPESMAIVRGANSSEPYWLRAVEYCATGCLQAVMDEYAHIMRESMGQSGKSSKQAATVLAERMADALTIRTSRVGIDNIRVSRNNSVLVRPKNIRIRFALRFGADRADEGGQVTREDQVRASFNSPFWPFVLATTSIGQEGLDFHQYCHAVVHWNLPSNPVDLEQREGRVHRYKGHAVRKNLAREFADSAWDKSTHDPWDSMFNAALQAKEQAVSDIYPFWVFPSEGGSHIERHVMNLPLSIDENRFHALRRTLAAYRMVFGQPRQEDMLDYLLEHFPEEELEEIAEKFRINLEPVQ